VGKSEVEAPHLTTMADSAAAMQREAALMQAHGQDMLAEGQRTSNAALVFHGEHWASDGRSVAQAARWMAMDPTAPANLNTPPGQLAAQGTWGSLTQTARAMLHDPSRARSVDLDALRWNGEAMQGEGKHMLEHVRAMNEDLAVMAALHQVDQSTASELRAAVEAVSAAGTHIAQNGRAMVDYADRTRRSLGLR
jgi:hypothetical protein